MQKPNTKIASTIDKKSLTEILESLKYKSSKSIEIARESILKENIKSKEAHKALKYYAENFLEPTPSALLTLACETVGNDADKAPMIGASLTLLVGAIDIHDDIIDQSTTKDKRQTVLGKFGKEIALLTGNAFLFEGFALLHRATRSLEVKMADYITETLKTTFFEMGDAHALETSLKGKIVTRPKEYLHIVEMKAASWEAVTKIGAIIGNGTKEEIEALARYGRIWGILSSIRNDFIDLFEIGELQNRMQNEILPLPILYAFGDLSIKNEIVTILSKEKMTTRDLEPILKSVFEARQVTELKKMLQDMISEAVSCLAILKESAAKATLRMFVSAMLENLD